MEIRIIVAVHKPYPLPQSSLYLPVQAGAALHKRLSCTGDDTGEHISEKNPLYCELSALYWAWKNLPADALGLCHYRRYFREPGHRQILREETLRTLLDEVPVILPKKRHYWIETGESQFVHAHGQESLDCLREVLHGKYPDFLNAFDGSMRRTSGHRFNMFIMRREFFDAYCEWLFEILSETERLLTESPPRMMGYLAERLTDSWIETTKTPFRELPLYLTERTNWVRKGSAFLGRKLKARK